MYIRYMLIAFLTNGLGAFGLRILAGAGLEKIPATNYLGFWYFSGFVLAAIVYFAKYGKPAPREVLIGGLMALCSTCGQLGMALALKHGIDGVVVYPVAIGGGMLLVVAVGIGIFREPMSWLGYLGIATGAAALVLLALE